jgi:hypothetical protein
MAIKTEKFATSDHLLESGKVKDSLPAVYQMYGSQNSIHILIFKGNTQLEKFVYEERI